MVLNHTRQRNVYPALYYARNIGNEDFSPRLTDKGAKDDSGKRKKADNCEVDYATYAEEFEQNLKDKLNELFNFELPFRRCDEQEAENICKYCDFKTLCKR